ncbi:MAG: hypothetical protein ACXWRU_18720 [Pseudobdellovibrionaceae bacterium]
MFRGMNKLTMLTLLTLGMISSGPMASALPKLKFDKITDVSEGYKNMTNSGKKAIAEHLLIWEAKMNKQKFRNDFGSSYYVEPNSSLTGGTSTALEVDPSGRVTTSKISLPESEIPAKEIIVSDTNLHGVTRIFDNPTGEIEVTESYSVLENKLGKFRRQDLYRRIQQASGIKGGLFYAGDFRSLALYILKNKTDAFKYSFFNLPDAIPGQINGFKITGDFSRLKIWVLDDSGSKPAITEYEYQIVPNDEGFTFKVLDNSKRLSASEVNHFKALKNVNLPREATKAKDKSVANGMTQEGTH